MVFGERLRARSDNSKPRTSSEMSLTASVVGVSIAVAMDHE
jgi:hypothetical protein